jgi:hypothetical protein
LYRSVRSRTAMMHCSCVFCCVGLDRVVVCCVVWGLLLCVGRGFLTADPLFMKAHETYKCTHSHRINPESLGASGPNSKKKAENLRLIRESIYATPF